jgi:hypothetical protein
MQDWGKSRRPPRERSRPPPRDPRADSAPPASTEETPLQAVARPPSSRPRPEIATRLFALEADLERMKSDRAHDADQIGEMLGRIAAAERTREAAVARALAAEDQAARLRSELAELKARCAQLEADAWDANAVTKRSVPPEATREGLARLGAIIDELERREEMSAGLRARTLEQMRQAIAEVDAPPSPPVRPSPVISVRPPRQSMAEPEPFPTE